MFDDKLVRTREFTNLALSIQTHYKASHTRMKQPPTARNGWTVLDLVVLKLNVHGVLFPEQQTAGVGSVLCDDKGRVLMVTTKPEAIVGDPLEIELLALLRGLQLYHLG